MTPTAEKRAAIREQMKRMREAMPRERRAEAAQRLVEQAMGMPEVARARVIMLYAPVGAELDTTPLMEKLRLAGKLIALPRLLPGREMEPVVCTGFDLPHDRRGLCVPGGPALEVEKLELVLVPGLAFDRAGGRIGYGAGYYDRFLPRVDAPFVGVCYDEQFLDALPQQPHDIPVHALLMPRGVWRVNGREALG